MSNFCPVITCFIDVPHTHDSVSRPMTAPSNLRETLERVAEILADTIVEPVEMTCHVSDLIRGVEALAALIGRLADLDNPRKHLLHESSCDAVQRGKRGVCDCVFGEARLVAELLSPERGRTT